MSTSPAPARPSALVVIARDGPAALEVLLLKRNEQVAFHGGAWVFPGGRVDPGDSTHAAEPELEVARRAAVRETREETGLDVGAPDLLPFAHWTTPLELPKRFATWFFACANHGQDPIRIDGSEIVDHRWLAPAAALALHAAGELELPAPTYVTLLGFAAYPSTAALAAGLRDAPVAHFVPRLVPVTEGRCTLYQEDAGYETLDIDAPGPRHRLIMKGRDWRYERAF